MEPKIQLIALPEAYFLLSHWSMSCGGAVQNGLQFAPANWPKQAPIPPADKSEDERKICLLTIAIPKSPLLLIDRYSSFTKLKRITAWILRFVNNCRSRKCGSKLLTSSISRRFHIIGHRKIIRSITRGCVTCRRISARPHPQMMGQLPIERITPGSVFNRVGVDYAGLVYIKYEFVRTPTVIKAYVCIFLSLSVCFTQNVQWKFIPEHALPV